MRLRARGYRERIRSRFARSRRTIVALALLAALVIAAVVVLVSRGGDDGPRIVTGAPDAGFPLRGDGAGDEAMIRDAADSWVRSERRADQRWAERDRPEVTVLWAGPIAADRDGVVLAAGDRAAFLHRLRGRDHWQRSDAVIEDADDPVIGRTSDGALVVPPPPEPIVTPIRFAERPAG